MKLQKLIHIVIGIVCFGLLPCSRAVSPPPDGGYPGQNTAEGDFALSGLYFGSENTATGAFALWKNNLGGGNTANGVSALSYNADGSCNTATGVSALSYNYGGYYNTATGYAALSRQGGNYAFSAPDPLPPHSQNTATGAFALTNNQRDGNTTNGSQALRYNTTGSFNTASGVDAFSHNTTGNNNTATGVRALGGNNSIDNTGSFNTATGVDALNRNTTGQRNTGNEHQSLFNNTTGYKNSANGVSSLLSNTAGHDNVAVGISALQNNTTGSFNIAIGSNAGANLTTGSDNIVIGPLGVAEQTNTIRIGAAVRHTATYIAGIYGAAVPSGVTVIVGSDGHLGTVPSSERFKTGIATTGKASEAILSLRPVTFHYKADTEGTPQFGLIAEEVAKLDPNLVVRDQNGEIYSVRYEAVNAMLLNEFLKEHCKNEEQEKTIAQLKSGMIALAATVKEQAAQIQKVSAQLEASNPAPHVVNNN